MPQCLCGGLTTLGVGSLLLPCGFLGDQTQIVSLCGERFYPLSHLAGPALLTLVFKCQNVLDDQERNESKPRKNSHPLGLLGTTGMIHTFSVWKAFCPSRRWMALST